MKKYIKNLMFFIVSSVIITLVFSSSLQGSNSVISLQNNVYLTDKAIEKEVVLYNFLSEAVYFDIKLNTSPFTSDLSVEKVLLLPNEYKTITYKLYPLNNSLSQTYTASIETSFAGNRFVEYFTINQVFNKDCQDLSLDLSYDNLEDGSINLKMLFRNSSSENKSIKITDITGVNLTEEKEINVSNNSEYLYSTIYSEYENKINVIYTCNNLIFNKEINILENNLLSGYFSLKFIGDFLDSIYFKILLVVFLVVLVLSFSTRYIRHINKK
ncbi:MAG: hypothetical protein PHX47_03395 [Candidatus ainarchaeum sp.]|nr:hypothetical protein [Candidatus ainarchaeum sp.]